MREVKVMGQTFEVRGLTRGELQVLEKKGYPVTRWGLDVDDLERDKKAEQMFDEILARGTSPKAPLNLEDLTPGAERKLFVAILAETYGDPDEEKNLPRSGPGAQTENE